MDDAPTTGQKVAAELLGTFVLVFFGCGAALMSGGDYLTTGLTFGLTVLVMAYAVGRISGGHFNPAVTLGAAVGGRLPWRLTPVYVGSQLVGGILAGAVLFTLMHGFGDFSAEGNLAQNSFGDQGTGYAWWAALLLELLLTAVFVWVILAVTDARNELQAALGPLAIGLSLAMIHFASMGATGTSVNPARSIGPALFAGVDAIVQLWLFILAPLLGAFLAGATYPLMFGRGEEPVAGSGLRSGRRGQPVYAPPTGYEQQWNPGQPQQWGPPQQWGQPGQPAQWGQPGQPAQPAPWGQPTQPAPPPFEQTQQPGAAQHWSRPAGDDEDGRTQVRRPD
jgi:MIP family channel proteins